MIEQTLEGFRHYLHELHTPVDPPEREPPPFDWAALAGQFTALRHDVNLQTKAVRVATEQTAQVLRAIPKASEPAPVPPSLKAILEIADNLALALRQVARSAETMRTLIEVPPAATSKPGFFSKLFGVSVKAVEPPATRSGLLAKLEPMFDGIAEGYTMSLRRVEKTLEQSGLDPIESVGKPFDPELMEVIEVEVGTNRPAGTVVEEFRRGYRQGGTVFRFAQVKVAR